MLAERMSVKENFYSSRLKRKIYPPSLLLISDDRCRTLNLERALTHNGCDVFWIDIRVDKLVTSYRNYFEMILLDVQTPQMSLRAWEEIEANPELLTRPIIILTNDCSDEAVRQLKASQIYCLPHDVTIERLLPLIHQISYMIGRYN